MFDLCIVFVCCVTFFSQIDAAGLDRKLLAKRIAECYLSQLIRHGEYSLTLAEIHYNAVVCMYRYC
jgi:hypothetical protein